MKKLMRRLSKVADSSQYCRLGESLRRVPGGHLPVYVGDEMERFVVSAELLNHPIFVSLLNKSAQEYGYAQKGVLRIPCHVILFERVLHTLRFGGESRDLHDQDLLTWLSDEQVAVSWD
ncbi:auxin-responsive protein SAUR71-like [Andrographis paniculata]|uniref:auxin-responsive protein SAUR71-like n=1 Tax=Andrographis paniculata TaxID=175694 RepID=UPI0021E75370|nr:auxin-responsive protein SAUR71-like [Andrographis paniculata]